jgi:hypothetical protein
MKDDDCQTADIKSVEICVGAHAQRANAVRLLLWKAKGRRRTIAKGEWCQGRNRTTDTAIFNRMLYQLSYLGAEPAGTGGEAERGAL